MVLPHAARKTLADKLFIPKYPRFTKMDKAPYAVKKALKESMEAHNSHLARIQATLGSGPIKFEFDFESLSAFLTGTMGQALERFGPIFYEDYFNEIANGLQSKVESDAMMPALVCAMMPKNVIRILIGGAKKPDDHPYHEINFSDGEMHVHIIQWANLYAIVDTMAETLIENVRDLPAVCNAHFLHHHC
jgi:hypothetical protein